MNRRRFTVIGIICLGIMLMTGCSDIDDIDEFDEDISAYDEDVSASDEDVSASDEDVSASDEDVSAYDEAINAYDEEQADLNENSGDCVFGTFETQTLNGDIVNQDIFADADLTMVNIWATFCSPCINEMPELGEISEEYADKGVQIVGIVCDVYEPYDETALDIVAQTGANYTHLILSQEMYSALEDVQVVPTTFFVDGNGNQVGETYLGARDKESWIEIIEEYRKE